MERNLLVPTVNKAVELMKAFLSSQLIEVEIDKDDASDSSFFVKLVWLSRDFESDEWVGCPCFVADFHGKLPTGEQVKGVVYVKCFPSKTHNVTRMALSERVPYYQFDFLDDGDIFKMHDKKGRFEDEVYQFKRGKIKKL